MIKQNIFGNETAQIVDVLSVTNALSSTNWFMKIEIARVFFYHKFVVK